MTNSAEYEFKLGLIGLGLAGIAHYAKLLDYPEAVVVAACRRNAVELESFCYQHGISRSYVNVGEMLEIESLDAVIIATPHNVVAEHLRAALGHCKAVLVEKPMATTAAEASTVEESWLTTRTPVIVAYPRRYRNHYVAASRWLKDGDIGSLLDGVCEWSDEYIRRYGQDNPDPPTFRSDPVQAVKGVLLDSGSHMLDALLWLTDAKIIQVAAFVRELKPSIEVAAALAFKFADEGLVTASLYPSATGFRRRRLLIAGSAGSVEIDDEKAVLITKSGTKTVPFLPQNLGPVDDLMNALRGQETIGCTVAQATAVVRVLDAAYHAAASGESISVTV